MNKNIYSDSSGGTPGQAENNEVFLEIVNQVLDKHRAQAAKSNEGQNL